MAKLELENISHSYGEKEVVEDLSFTVEAGEVACLLGPSGCGKTTLLRLVAGLAPLQSGVIRLNKKIISEPAGGIETPPEERNVGFMFQDYALFPHLDVFHNITFGLKNPSPERLAEIQRAMIQMDIVELTDAYPHTLSGGQQQRVALLRALAPLPRLLLLDEPFSGLDISLRVQVREDMLKLIKQMGVTTLMVTHDPMRRCIWLTIFWSCEMEKWSKAARRAKFISFLLQNSPLVLSGRRIFCKASFCRPIMMR